MIFYYPLSMIKPAKRREKITVVLFGMLVNICLVYFTKDKLSSRGLNLYLALLPVNLMFLAFYFLPGFFKKFNIENRLDGDLVLKETFKKDFNIINCPYCRKRTISWMHALKEPQTCGECSKKSKAIISKKVNLALGVLTFVTFFFGLIFLSKGLVSKPIGLLIMLSGFLIQSFYRLKPKSLIQVSNMILSIRL